MIATDRGLFIPPTRKTSKTLQLRKADGKLIWRDRDSGDDSRLFCCITLYTPSKWGGEVSKEWLDGCRVINFRNALSEWVNDYIVVLFTVRTLGGVFFDSFFFFVFVSGLNIALRANFAGDDDEEETTNDLFWGRRRSHLICGRRRPRCRSIMSRVRK